MHCMRTRLHLFDYVESNCVLFSYRFAGRLLKLAAVLAAMRPYWQVTAAVTALSTVQMAASSLGAYTGQ